MLLYIANFLCFNWPESCTGKMMIGHLTDTAIYSASIADKIGHPPSKYFIDVPS